MQITFTEIQQAVPLLPFEEKARLASIILKDLHEPDSADDLEAIWSEEILKRSAAYRDGTLSSSPSEEVIDRIRAQIRK